MQFEIVHDNSYYTDNDGIKLTITVWQITTNNLKKTNNEFKSVDFLQFSGGYNSLMSIITAKFVFPKAEM